MIHLAFWWVKLFLHRLWALAALAEGLGIRTVARVFEVAPNTVLAWFVEVAEHLEVCGTAWKRSVATSRVARVHDRWPYEAEKIADPQRDTAWADTLSHAWRYGHGMGIA
jgi:hypothetical protein